MPLNPKYRQHFLDLLEGRQFGDIKDKILNDYCQRLCTNTRALHGHQLKHKQNHLWSADIPKDGRGEYRILFQIHCPITPEIPENEIHFIDIQNTH